MTSHRVTRQQLIHAYQARVARVTVGASALRGQGKGIAHPAREFFAALPLRDFSVASASTFASRLDAATADLQGKFPKGSGSWGIARKLLNIFLREALYTTYLAEKYNLAKSESLLELPLDSITGKHLYALHLESLPRWQTVKSLDPDVSAQYQAVAKSHADALGIARIHLDAIWWGQRDDRS